VTTAPTSVTTLVREPAAAGPEATSATTTSPVPGADGSGLRSAGRFAVQVTAWLVILVLVAGLVAAVLVPRLVGGTAFTVLTGSMAPTYPPGTLIVDRQVDPDDITIGDAVTFQIESGQPQVVTHRVIAVRTGEDGEPEFMTQGDANDSPDAGWRPAAAVRGEVWYAIPHLGRIDGVLSGDTRQLGIYVVAGLLVVYAGGNLLGAARDRRRDS
jgi:signal peptidase I